MTKPLPKHVLDCLNHWQDWPNICSRKPQPQQLSPLHNGLTNENWLLDSNNKQWVIRFNALNGNDLLLNRDAEWDIQAVASQKKLTVEYCYRHPKDVYWIRPYIHNATLQEHINQIQNIEPETLSRISQTLKTLHSIPIHDNWPKINFQQRISHYWQQVQAQGSQPELNNQLKVCQEALDKSLNNTEYTQALCHMDTNTQNWIYHDSHFNLIDWEYAGIGNPLWDLAVLQEDLNLNSEQLSQLLNSYGHISFLDFKLASKQMQYLSALWFCVQKIIDHKTLLQRLINISGH